MVTAVVVLAVAVAVLACGCVVLGLGLRARTADLAGAEQSVERLLSRLCETERIAAVDTTKRRTP